MYHVSDGSLLATIDLLSYLKSWPVEDELRLTASSLSSSSFCLLQVSADLSTAVAVTQSRTAVAVDLNHYFRWNVPVTDCDQWSKGSQNSDGSEPRIELIKQTIVWRSCRTHLTPGDVTDWKCSVLCSRRFPNHLYCVVPVSRPPLQPQQADDQDSVSSCGRSLISLGLNFTLEW